LGIDDTAPFRVGSVEGPPFHSAEHFAGFDRLEHGAEVVAMFLGVFHLVGDRFAIQPFALGNLLRAFGERFR
jgi:hypothetical protein